MSKSVSTKKKRSAPKGASEQAAVKAEVNRQLLMLLQDGDIECAGYTSLDHDPTILTACQVVASLVGLISWHIMENTDGGDRRIRNELSRKIDIDPNSYMTRADFFEAIAMNMLLYGNGNGICASTTKMISATAESRPIRVKVFNFMLSPPFFLYSSRIGAPCQIFDTSFFR